MYSLRVPSSFATMNAGAGLKARMVVLLVVLAAALATAGVMAPRSEAVQQSALSVDIPVDVDRSLQSFNFPGLYVRHRNFLVDLTGISSPLDRKDATWQIVPGLAGTGVSLESVNFPGSYLRHQGFRFKLHRNDGSQLFREDATFLPRRGLIRARGSVSFESYNFRGWFLRHRGFEFWLDPSDGSDLFRADGTFFMRAPLA